MGVSLKKDQKLIKIKMSFFSMHTPIHAIKDRIIYNILYFNSFIWFVIFIIFFS